MISATYQQQVGTTILDQLARTTDGSGFHRLQAMVGAMDIKTLQASDTSEVVPPLSFGAGFRFKGSKAWNGIEIFLNLGDDSYSLRFYSG